MQWLWRLIGMLLVIALVAGGLVAGFGWWTVQRPWPQADGSLQLPGLTAPVEVVRDERGVANIYADTTDDLFFAHGFVHAQDRFWEMDVRRLATAGRLAELLGADYVEGDVLVRSMDWRGVAEEEYSLLSPDARRVLQAYSAGVNAYLAERQSSRIAVEYQVLALQNPDYVIASWNPIDSLTWLKAMAWHDRGNVDAELQRVLGAAEVGADRIEQLFPPYPQNRVGTILPTDLPPGERASAQPDPQVLSADAVVAFRTAAGRVSALAEVFTPTGEASGANSFVVSGEHTANGAPLLANDPHAWPSMPSPWYQVGLHCRKVNAACPYAVSGWSMAGLPGIVIGHNNRVAWGLADLVADTADLVLHKVTGDTYVVNGKAQPLQSRPERIGIAGGGWQDIIVRETRHGPIVSDATRPELAQYPDEAGPPASVDDQPEGEADPAADGDAEAPSADEPQQAANQDGYAVALRWTALQASPTYDAVLLLNTAQNWRDFLRAARLYAAPAQSILYADRAGNIGYRAPGSIPVRSGYDGRWPVPGWNGKYDWPRTIPASELPRSLNPDQGFLTAANQRVVPASYPRPVQSDVPAYGARAARINARLGKVLEAGGVTAARIAEIQLDSRSDLAVFLVPLLAELPGVGDSSPNDDLDGGSSNAEESNEAGTNDGESGGGGLSDGAAEAVAALAAWDFRQGTGSAPAAYFNAFLRALLDRLVADEIPAAVVPDPTGDQMWEAIRRLWSQPDDPWWDDVRTEAVEQRDQTVAAALEAAYSELSQAQGPDPANWRWGEMHTVTFQHRTLGATGNQWLEIVLNRGPEPVAGGSSVPLATGWPLADDYQVSYAPSMRQVVDLGDFDASTWVSMTGNSGHAYHPNSGDQIRAWLAGEQFPWPYSEEAVRAEAADTLILTP